MKRLSFTFLLFFLISCVLPFHSEAQSPSPSWSVYFSPKGGCTQAIINELDKAKSSILVQAYSFTSAPIAKALLNAHKRGVKVEVILDRSRRTEKYSSADFMANQGIPTRIDSAHGIAHNKVMIIDGETVITGSFNFTKAAEERNAENILVIKDKSLAAKYVENWKKHEGHSEAYSGKSQQ
jgi:phosphatidylserine/phosphatidylglycerophosphate/cardiolipin synthase-like enzyme